MNMKMFFAALCFAALATATSAQTVYKLGFSAGTNYSSLKSDQFTTASGRLGLAAGASVLVGFSDFFELNQEIMFVQKGASAKTVRFRPEQQPEEQTYDYFYNTFEAGLFAGFQLSKQVPIRLQVGGFVGTHFHSMDRSKRDQMVGDYQSINNATRAVDLNDAFSGVDYGPAIGISAGNNRFRANARYYYGARNLYNNLDFVEEGHTIRTNSLRLTLTYFLK